MRKISLSHQNNHWLNQTRSSLLKFSVQYSKRGYVLWNLCAVCSPHHHDQWFIHLFYFQVFFLTDPRSPILHHQSSILDPDFPVNPEVLLIMIIVFFDHWSNHLFKSNQRFQAIEFVDRPVPKKLDMGFLFYGHEVLQVECVIVWYKGARINTSVLHTYLTHVNLNHVNK